MPKSRPATEIDPKAPEQNLARNETEVYYIDWERLHECLSEQWFPCRVCGERINGCNLIEGMLEHARRHDKTPATQRQVKELLRELRRRPDVYLALLVRDMASDPATREQMQREGVLVKVGKG